MNWRLFPSKPRSPWKPRLSVGLREKLHRLRYKLRLPVSRGRYEREIAYLKLSTTRCIADERQQLRGLIDRLSYIETVPRHGVQEIHVAMRVTDELLVHFHPAFLDRLVFEIADRLAHDLKRSLRNTRPLSPMLGADCPR